MVPQSANHFSSFLSTDGFPEAFGRNSPKFPQPISDLVRLSLLYEFGGIWLDVSCMVFCDLDDIWEVIQNPKTPYTMSGYITNLRPKEYHILNTSALFSQKGDALMKRWRDAFSTLWQGRTSPKDIHKDLLVSWLGLYGAETLEDYDKDEASLKSFTDYLGVHLCFERLLLIQDPSDGFDGRAYWANKVFKLDMISDQAYAQEVTEYDGQRLFDLFASQREGLGHEERNQEAESLTNYVCANATIVKLFAGLGANQVWLPALWNRTEDADADIKEGSFIAFLRYAQVHLRPTRRVVNIETEAIPDDYIVRMGACERKEVQLARRQLRD
jgi:hypothetical protein